MADETYAPFPPTRKQPIVIPATSPTGTKEKGSTHDLSQRDRGVSGDHRAAHGPKSKVFKPQEIRGFHDGRSGQDGDRGSSDRVSGSSPDITSKSSQSSLSANLSLNAVNMDGVNIEAEPLYQNIPKQSKAHPESNRSGQLSKPTQKPQGRHPAPTPRKHTRGGKLEQNAADDTETEMNHSRSDQGGMMARAAARPTPAVRHTVQSQRSQDALDRFLQGDNFEQQELEPSRDMSLGDLEAMFSKGTFGELETGECVSESPSPVSNQSLLTRQDHLYQNIPARAAKRQKPKPAKGKPDDAQEQEIQRETSFELEVRDPPEESWEPPSGETAAQKTDRNPMEAHYEGILHAEPPQNLTNVHDPLANGFVTMTGTLKRGNKTGGNPVEVQLTLSRKEMKELQRRTKLEEDRAQDCVWGLKKGIHVFLLSLLYIPFAFLTSLVMSFYIGTLTWYNIFIYMSEEKTCCHRIFLCPLLIIFYPVLILPVCLAIALYAAVVQISWYLSSWYKEIRDFEKGFFGGVCDKMGVPHLAPYEIVILDEDPVISPDSATRGSPGTEAQSEV